MKVTVSQWLSARDNTALLEVNHQTKKIKVTAYEVNLAQLGELAEACVEATRLLTSFADNQPLNFRRS